MSSATNSSQISGHQLPVSQFPSDGIEQPNALNQRSLTALTDVQHINDGPIAVVSSPVDQPQQQTVLPQSSSSSPSPSPQHEQIQHDVSPSLSSSSSPSPAPPAPPSGPISFSGTASTLNKSLMRPSWVNTATTFLQTIPNSQHNTTTDIPSLILFLENKNVYSSEIVEAFCRVMPDNTICSYLIHACNKGFKLSEYSKYIIELQYKYGIDGITQYHIDSLDKKFYILQASNKLYTLNKPHKAQWLLSLCSLTLAVTAGITATHAVHKWITQTPSPSPSSSSSSTVITSHDDDDCNDNDHDTLSHHYHNPAQTPSSLLDTALLSLPVPSSSSSSSSSTTVPHHSSSITSQQQQQQTLALSQDAQNSLNVIEGKIESALRKINTLNNTIEEQNVIINKQQQHINMTVHTLDKISLTLDRLNDKMDSIEQQQQQQQQHNTTRDMNNNDKSKINMGHSWVYNQESDDDDDDHNHSATDPSGGASDSSSILDDIYTALGLLSMKVDALQSTHSIDNHSTTTTDILSLLPSTSTTSTSTTSTSTTTVPLSHNDPNNNNNNNNNKNNTDLSSYSNQLSHLNNDDALAKLHQLDMAQRYGIPPEILAQENNNKDNDNNNNSSSDNNNNMNTNSTKTTITTTNPATIDDTTTTATSTIHDTPTTTTLTIDNTPTKQDHHHESIKNESQNQSNTDTNTTATTTTINPLLQQETTYLPPTSTTTTLPFPSSHSIDLNTLSPSQISTPSVSAPISVTEPNKLPDPSNNTDAAAATTNATTATTTTIPSPDQQNIIDDKPCCPQLFSEWNILRLRYKDELIQHLSSLDQGTPDYIAYLKNIKVLRLYLSNILKTPNNPSYRLLSTHNKLMVDVMAIPLLAKGFDMAGFTKKWSQYELELNCPCSKHVPNKCTCQCTTQPWMTQNLKTLNAENTSPHDDSCICGTLYKVYYTFNDFTEISSMAGQASTQTSPTTSSQGSHINPLAGFVSPK